MLIAALASIYENPPPFPFEVFVVDNDSLDGSAAAVAEQFAQVILIANKENAGYARGNNQALDRAGGAYRLLLNPDVLVPPKTLTAAVEFMEAHADAGALGVRQVHPDGRLQPSVRGVPFAACYLVGTDGYKPPVSAQSCFRRVPHEMVRL